MKITREITTAQEVRRTATGGAVQTLSLLTDDEIERIIIDLEESTPDGMTACEFNDFWWFATDDIAQFVGYADYEEMFEERTR